ELPLPLHGRSSGRPGGEEHSLADRHHGPAAGAVRLRRRDDGRTREARCGLLPHSLLPAGAGTPGRRDDGVRLPAQPGYGAGERDPRTPRDRGPALVPVAPMVEAVADAAQHLGRRQPHDHLSRRDPRRAAAPVRVGRARRRQCAAAHALGDAADDQPGHLVLHRDQRHRGAAVLHPGVRRRQHRRRAGLTSRRPNGQQPRLSGGLDAVLPSPALPARIQVLQHGLRLGPLGAAPDRRLHGDGRDHQELTPLGPLRRGREVSTASVPVTAGSLVRRKPPWAVRRRRFLVGVANHSLLIAAAIIFLAPFAFIVLTSLMTNEQALSAHLWPHPFRWQNYIDVFHDAPILRWALNTFMYSVLATLGVLCSSIPVAYALSRIRWRGRDLAFATVLIALMLPPVVSVVPLYVMWAKLHLVGNLGPLIIPNWFGDAFSIFLLRQFFMTIPEEYLDAARVDGCGELRIL